MDKAIREIQMELLAAFAKAAKSFALAGGTALELFYLKHRFSRDLDFFSPKYDEKEIKRLLEIFSDKVSAKIKLENEFFSPDHARVRFYSLNKKATGVTMKIDFIEDVLFAKPDIRKFNHIPVYGAKEIYLQKITALTGTRLTEDEIGREVITGREEARDAFDIYYLSKKIEPLRLFMKKLKRPYQRGVVQWYRSFSRQELKLGISDLDIYDKKFDVSAMIRYLDNEIKGFMREVAE